MPSVSPEVATFLENSSLEGEGMISIVGARGSGKTTLLAAACVELLTTHSAIVLPIIRPENFRATDSLTTIVVSSLADLLTDALKERGPSKRRESADLELDAHKTLRAAALSTSALGLSLAQKSESLSQYALDVLGVIQSREELIPSLRTLVRHIRRELGRDGDQPIIIPLDDADLIPGRSAEVLSELRLLSAVDGLIPIVTLHRDDLQRHVEADLSREYGAGATTDAIVTLARQQIDKTLRPAQTIEPSIVPAHLRATFVPIGHAMSVFELLSKVLVHLDRGGKSAEHVLNWIRSAPEARSRTNVHGAAWLPETPRQLETLWRVLHQLEQSLALTSPTASTWLKHFVELVGSGSPGLFRMTFDVIEMTFETGRLSAVDAVTGWTNVELYSDPQVNRRARIAAPFARIDFRPFLEPLLDHSDDDDKAAGSPRRKVNSFATSSILMIHSIFQLAAFDGHRPGAPGTFQGFDYWPLQSVRLLSETTDNRFFTMPVTKGAVLFERSRTTWNHLTRGLVLSGGAKPEVLVEAYVSAVADVWLGGKSLPEQATTLKESMSRITDRYVAISDALGRPADFFANYSAELAYCRWYESQLPYVFHDLLLPEDTVEDVVSIWYAAVMRNELDGAADEIRNELRDALRTRIEKSVSETNRATQSGTWFYGYRALLQVVDPELSNSVSHHREKYQTLRRKAALGRSLASSAVTKDVNGSIRWSENVPSAAGDFELELILQTADRLREA
ncbi:AAA family ATPase [Planococcus sp. APC 4015]|nr:AAA family ATPase [Planococcus sp. APC 4015]